VLARAKVNTRAVKVALYGLLVSAPLSHVLVGELQRAFAGKTGRAAKLGQILAGNLIVSPIQTFCGCLSFFLSPFWDMALLLGFSSLGM
jgi:peroxisomal membrane protein 2